MAIGRPTEHAPIGRRHDDAFTPLRLKVNPIYLYIQYTHTHIYLCIYIYVCIYKYMYIYMYM